MTSVASHVLSSNQGSCNMMKQRIGSHHITKVKGMLLFKAVHWSILLLQRLNSTHLR
jgi:hypothetical protein